MSKRAPDEFAVVSRAPLIVPPDFDLRPPDPGSPRPNIGTTSDQARVALTGRPSEPSPAAQVLTGASAATISGAPTSPRGAATDGVPASAIADDLLSAGTNMPRSSPPAEPGGVTAAAPGPAATPTASAAVAATTAATPAGARAGGETTGEMAMVARAGGSQGDPDIRRIIAEENQTLADVEASLFTRVVAWREPSTMGTTIDAPAEAQRLRDNKTAGRSATADDSPTVVQRRQSALQGLWEDLF